MSDYIPILLYTHTVTQSHQKPFRFLKVWTEDTGSGEIVQHAWNQLVKLGMESHRICQKLLVTSSVLSKWNMNHFGYAQYHIKSLEADLERSLIDEKMTKTKELEEDLRVQQKRLEQIYLQKSKEMWLKE